MTAIVSSCVFTDTHLIIVAQGYRDTPRPLTSKLKWLPEKNLSIFILTHFPASKFSQTARQQPAKVAFAHAY